MSERVRTLRAIGGGLDGADPGEDSDYDLNEVQVF